MSKTTVMAQRYVSVVVRTLLICITAISSECRTAYQLIFADLWTAESSSERLKPKYVTSLSLCRSDTLINVFTGYVRVPNKQNLARDQVCSCVGALACSMLSFGLRRFSICMTDFKERTEIKPGMRRN